MLSKTLNLCSVLLLVFTAAARALPITVHNQELGFTLTVPDGFHQLETNRLPGPAWLYAFQVQGKISGIAEATIGVTRMGGEIGREPPDLAAVRQGFRKTSRDAKPVDLRTYTEHWNGFEIQAIRAEKELPAGSMISRSAQVPLRPEAVQLVVSGPASRDSQLNVLLEQLLRSLKGESNWLNDDERSNRLGEGAGRLGGWIIGILVVFYLLGRSSRGKRAARSLGQQA